MSDQKIVKQDLRAQALQAGMTPLEFLKKIYRDPKQPVKYRIEAAKAACPYVHKKMPVAVEIESNTVSDLVKAIYEGAARAGVVIEQQE